MTKKTATFLPENLQCTGIKLGIYFIYGSACWSGHNRAIIWALSPYQNIFLKNTTSLVSTVQRLIVFSLVHKNRIKRLYSHAYVGSLSPFGTMVILEKEYWILYFSFS